MGASKHSPFPLVLTGFLALGGAALPLAGQLPAPAVGDVPMADVPELRLGVLYNNTDVATGERYLAGIREAIDGLDFVAEPLVRTYANEEKGFELLQQMVEGGEVDVVLGPTESGLFVAATKRLSAVEEQKIPIISPLIAADVDHVEGDWFFRINIDVRRRSQAVYDHLNKLWLRSISLLYANTEFGHRAEKAFREELSGAQLANYTPLLYNSPPVEARGQLRQVLNDRPEAVGIIGEREDILEIYTALRRMNDWGTPYSPILFTIIDVRATEELPESFLFVSVTDSDLSDEDDVRSLAYAAARLASELWREIPKELEGTLRREAFRDQFEATLNGHSTADWKSNLRFSRYVNITPPFIYRRVEGVPSKVNMLEAASWSTKLSRKYGLVKGRYGSLPLLWLLMIVTVVILSTSMELKKWQQGERSIWGLAFNTRGFRDILRQKGPRGFFTRQGFRYQRRVSWNLFLFVLLYLIHIAVACGLYVYLAESGEIRYDSFVAALALALAPTAIIRTRLFPTKTGQLLNLEKIYDGLLKRINDRLMVESYVENKVPVNLIAYNNSLDGMKSYLLDIYKESYSAERRALLSNDLERDLAEQPTYIEKRKYCAKILLQTVRWEQLHRDNLAPCTREDLESDEPPKDPEVVLREKAQIAAQSNILREQIDYELDAALRDKDEERRAELAAALARDLDGVVGETGRQRRKLAFLCVIKGYDRGWLDHCFPATAVDKDQESSLHMNLLAYNNSVNGMRSYLKDFFSVARTIAQKAKMEADLEAELKLATTYLERRKIAARFLARSVPWERLQADNMAPVEARSDPEILIRQLAQHFASERCCQTVREALDTALDGLDDAEHRADLKTALEADLQGVVGTQSRLRRELALLCVVMGFEAFYQKFHQRVETGSGSRAATMVA